MTARSSSVLTIGALARASGASVRAIRHYENMGLLQSQRGGNGYRLFSHAAAARIRQIRRLLALGFTLDEIHRFPACVLAADGAPLCPELDAVQRARLRDIERQIDALEHLRLRLLQSLRDGVPPPLVGAAPTPAPAPESA